MEIAEKEQRIIVTFDRDYGELIYRYNFKPSKGVIYLRIETFSPKEPAIHVHYLLNILKVETDRRRIPPANYIQINCNQNPITVVSSSGAAVLQFY